jgi:hypothetical protein
MDVHSMTRTPTQPHLTPPSDSEQSPLSQKLVILENTPPRAEHPLVHQEEKQGIGSVHFLLSSIFVFLFLSMVGFPASLAVFTEMKTRAEQRLASQTQLPSGSSCPNRCEQCSHRNDGGSCTDDHDNTST